MKTVKEIATQHDVSIHTVRTWIKTHKLKATQTVVGYVVEEKELERFLKSRKEKI